MDISEVIVVVTVTSLQANILQTSMPHKTQEAGEGVAVVWGVSHTEDICHPWL